MRTLSAQLVNKVMHKTNTHIEVLPPSVYALRGIIFYTVAKINQIRIYEVISALILIIKPLIESNR